jgi:hypothetical protein
MSADRRNSGTPLIVRVQKLFRKELAAENDYLRAENRVLRAKFGKRVPLTEHDRRVLVKYGVLATGSRDQFEGEKG